MRLDALGRKLVRMASIDKAEFDFDLTPALGGPETISNMGLEPDELSQAIEQLSFELENRENQLAVLENLVLDENLQKEIQPSGRPMSDYQGLDFVLLRHAYPPAFRAARNAQRYRFCRESGRPGNCSCQGCGHLRWQALWLR
jgi:hypothetical protein